MTHFQKTLVCIDIRIYNSNKLEITLFHRNSDNRFKMHSSKCSMIYGNLQNNKIENSYTFALGLIENLEIVCFAIATSSIY